MANDIQTFIVSGCNDGQTGIAIDDKGGIYNLTVHLASQSPNHPLTVTLLGANTINGPFELDTIRLISPATANMVPTNYLESLYGDRLTIEDDPADAAVADGCSVVMRAFRLLEVSTEDATRVYVPAAADA